MVDVYDVTFLCTYKQIDDDELYRVQLLQAFNLTSWDNSVMRTSVDKIFIIVGGHFNKILDRLCSEKSCLSHMIMFLGQSPSQIDLFQTLFCADVFQEAHICISNILTTGSIEQCNYKSLEKCIFEV